MADNIYRYLMICVGVSLLIIGVYSFYRNEVVFNEFFKTVSYAYEEEVEWGHLLDSDELVEYNRSQINAVSDYSKQEVYDYLLGLYLYKSQFEELQIYINETFWELTSLEEIKRLLENEKFYHIRVDTSLNEKIRRIYIMIQGVKG